MGVLGYSGKDAFGTIISVDGPGRLLPEAPLDVASLRVSTSVPVHGDLAPHWCQILQYFSSFLHKFIFLSDPAACGPSP